MTRALTDWMGYLALMARPARQVPQDPQDKSARQAQMARTGLAESRGFPVPAAYPDLPAQQVKTAPWAPPEPLA
ncbi:MAG: hypothetical protein Q4P23_03470 [Micrococcaceae bacterium]|nr:hypothetical protein [Micrococcaceae bacterium]